MSNTAYIIILSHWFRTLASIISFLQLYDWILSAHQGVIGSPRWHYIRHMIKCITDLMYLEVVHMKGASYWRMDHPHSQYTQYYGNHLLSFYIQQVYIYQIIV